MFIHDQKIKGKYSLIEVLKEFSDSSAFHSPEMDLIWQPILSTIEAKNEQEYEAQTESINTFLAERLLSQFEAFEVSSGGLYGTNKGKRVKLAWIED